MSTAPLQNELDLARHRRALVAYCYRLSGSLHEAEDLAQETLLRAWKRRETLADGALVRPWLYRIATNACLDALKSSRRRELPQALRGPSSGAQPMDPPALDTPWIEPAPDGVFDDEVLGPEGRYSRAQSVSLAFIATLNRLNPKQRAMVLLRDVLGWSAKETADTLEMTEAAVHSALARARVALEEPGVADDPISPAATDVLKRYLRAWQDRNLNELVALLRADAVLAMPPLPCWYRGPADVCAALMQSVWSPDRGELALREIRGNGCWGMAGWHRPAGAPGFLPLGVQLVRLREGQVSEIVCFVGEVNLAAFGFPAPPA